MSQLFKKIIVIIIYLSGVFFAYKKHKYIFIKTGFVYTVSDQHACVLLSTGSWLSFAAGCFYEYISNRDETPAKW